MSRTNYTFNFYITSFKVAKKRASNLLENIDEELFMLPPSKNKWSIAEIMSHLIEAGISYLQQVESALKQPHEQLPKGSGPFTHSFMFELFIKIVSPANKVPIPTVASFVPKDVSVLDRQKLLKEFIIIQEAFIMLLTHAQSHSIDIGTLKTKNPVFEFINMPVSSCFAVVEAHQRRHLEQIQNIKKEFE
ncbi:MAG: DinB family protein [Balneolaceae bacterium]|nr:DinB family protein [Balneolaceae bacterium]